MLVSTSTCVVCHEWPESSVKHVYTPERSKDSQINTISWGKDGGWAILVPASGPAELVSFNDQFKLLHTIQSIQHPTCAYFQNSTKRNVAVGTATGQLLIYDIKNKSVKKRFPHAPSGFFKVQYCLKDTHIVAGCNNGEIYIYNNNNLVLSGSFKVPNSKTLSNFQCHPFKRNLIGGCSEEGIVTVWDLNTSKYLTYNSTHCAPITDIAFSKSNLDIVATSGMDRKIAFFNFRQNAVVGDMKLSRTPTAIEYSPNGNEILVGFQDGRLAVYDTRNLTESTQTLAAHKTKINQIVFEKETDDKSSEFSLPEEKIELDVQQKISEASVGNLLLPDIPETENEFSSENVCDSFMDAIGLNVNSPSHATKNSFFDTTDGIKKLNENTSHLNATEPRRSINLKFDSLIKSHASTPNQMGDPKNSSPFYSPIIAHSTNPNINNMNTNSETLLNTDLKKMIKEAVKEEMEDLKNEMKFQFMEFMGGTRRHFLDLQMALVREFIRIEDQMNELKDVLLCGDNDQIN